MLEQDGWYLARTKGSHRQFKHPTKPGGVTVSGNLGKKMPPGTLNSVLKQAKLKKQSMKYMVVIEKGKTSYGAYVPDLPGCVAVGDTRTEALQLIQEAIGLHLEMLREEGQIIPEPVSVSDYIAVPA
ncbi:MAG: addiction module toxin, HicA family [Chloroflexi bacterium]|nr:addiction module toxin, HicA family [Chloroflexota bacterium]